MVNVRRQIRPRYDPLHLVSLVSVVGGFAPPPAPFHPGKARNRALPHAAG